MQRRTQGVVALGASAVLGVVAGVLISSTGPGREVTDPNTVPSQRGGAPSPSPSTATHRAAVPDAPTNSESAAPDTRSASPTPSEIDDNRGRGRGSGSGSDNSGSGSDNSGDNDSGDDGAGRVSRLRRFLASCGSSDAQGMTNGARTQGMAQV